MKLKKIIFICTLLILTACNNQTNTSIDTEEVFESELKDIYSLYEVNGKTLLTNAEDEQVNKVISDITNIVCNDLVVSTGTAIQGIIRNNGERITAMKVPVEIEFCADENNTKSFLNNLIELDKRLVIGDILINEAGDLYKVDSDFYLCAECNQESNTEVGTFAIEHIEGKENKIEQIVLRDSSLLLTLRPFTSDSATVSLGLTKDETGESYVYYDENELVELDIKIYSKDNKYYCEYENMDNQKSTYEVKLKNNEIIFDILSCERSSKDDKAGVKLKIENSSSKKVNIKVFDDKDKRVVVEKQGNIEVR